MVFLGVIFPWYTHDQKTGKPNNLNSLIEASPLGTGKMLVIG
jgi:hypothetical protein